MNQRVQRISVILAAAAASGIGLVLLAQRQRLRPASRESVAAVPTNSSASTINKPLPHGQTLPARAAQTSAVVAAESSLPTMEAAQAVMVTVELDFGPKPPSIAEALRAIERRYEPDDGKGRTFAILDAYGEPTADGKLHISMHVSSEKSGIGALVFRHTGEVVWKTRITPAKKLPTSSFASKGLFILLDDGQGKAYVLDGSKSGDSVRGGFGRLRRFRF